MITTEFLANHDLVKSWNETSKTEICKLVRQTMDESSPVYGGVPEIDKESEAYRLGFQRGYSFYHKKLQELGTISQTTEPIKATYPPRK